MCSLLSLQFFHSPVIHLDNSIQAKVFLDNNNDKGLELKPLKHINHYNYNMSLLTIILNILLPPLSVFMKHGVGSTLLISILLTLLAWLPGVIHAFIVNK